ncbi:MAG: hypothetical protein KKG43_02625, partial [Candidatus Omnitrophica bacterium]|nr:hypothetical protein [Candidatus Omnitrophota bacterium]
MTNPKQYGWLPDIPDQRDYLYSAIKPKVRLPKKINLIKNCSVVEDQKRLGSCTACALAGNLEFLDIIDTTGTVPATGTVPESAIGSLLGDCPVKCKTGTVPVEGYTGTLDRGLSRFSKYTDVSRLFIYYNERALRNNED